MRLMVPLLVLLCGCAARAPHSTAHITIPRECILSVRLSPKTRCEGPDKDHMVCVGITLTKISGCGTISATPK